MKHSITAMAIGFLVISPAHAEDACQAAKAYAEAASESLADGLTRSAGNPTNASRILTSRPTLETLWNEFDAAITARERACHI